MDCKLCRTHICAHWALKTSGHVLPIYRLCHLFLFSTAFTQDIKIQNRCTCLCWQHLFIKTPTESFFFIRTSHFLNHYFRPRGWQLGRSSSNSLFDWSDAWNMKGIQIKKTCNWENYLPCAPVGDGGGCWRGWKRAGRWDGSRVPQWESPGGYFRFTESWSRSVGFSGATGQPHTGFHVGPGAAGAERGRI